MTNICYEIFIRYKVYNQRVKDRDYNQKYVKDGDAMDIPDATI